MPDSPSPDIASAEDGSGLAPREVALDLLTAVLRRRLPLDDALETDAAFAALPPRDRAFTRNLIATAIRRLGQIDDLIDLCLERRLPPGAGVTQDVLRLGVAQLLFTEVPGHAAVNTSVALAERRGQGHMKKLVNAVLRRLGREGDAFMARQDEARLVTPEWLWTSWTGAYGYDTAKCLARAGLAEAPLDLTLGKGNDPAEWAERLGAEVLPTGTLRLPLRRAGKGAVTALPGFDQGAWWVQDVAAALPARLLGDVAGKDVIDLCAAPGGKTAQLAAAGARVTAVDRSQPRLDRLRDNLRRLKLDAVTIAADATRWRPDVPADALLLDAPCSATGTLRRHPDVAWLKGPQDVAKLADLQGRLLEAAVEMVRPGGVIVYCTCSLQPEEGVARVTAALDGRLPLERMPIGPDEVAGLAELLTPAGELRTMPFHMGESGGMDGFFAARLRRLG